jgi:hypothetical protein
MPTAQQLREVIEDLQVLAAEQSAAGPLTAYVIKCFGENNETSVWAQLRTTCFYYWCVLRVINSYTSRLPYCQTLLDEFEAGLIEFAKAICNGNIALGKKIYNQFFTAFSCFDAVFDRPQGDPLPGLSLDVLEFITDGASRNEHRLEIIILPTSVLIDIQKRCAVVLNRKLGLNVP